MQHTTDYHDTFIEAAADTPAAAGLPPPLRQRISAARWQYEQLIGAPYALTSDDLLFAWHAHRNAIPAERLALEREAFFSKAMACMRASDLPKKYGWGVHFDARGRMALYGMETEAYRAFAADSALRHHRAMRRRR